jgi:hypothetical protein
LRTRLWSEPGRPQAARPIARPHERVGTARRSLAGAPRSLCGLRRRSDPTHDLLVFDAAPREPIVRTFQDLLVNKIDCDAEGILDVVRPIVWPAIQIRYSSRIPNGVKLLTNGIKPADITRANLLKLLLKPRRPNKALLHALRIMRPIYACSGGLANDLRSLFKDCDAGRGVLTFAPAFGISR